MVIQNANQHTNASEKVSHLIILAKPLTRPICGCKLLFLLFIQNTSHCSLLTHTNYTNHIIHTGPTHETHKTHERFFSEIIRDI